MRTWTYAVLLIAVFTLAACSGAGYQMETGFNDQVGANPAVGDPTLIGAAFLLALLAVVAL